MEQIQIGDPGLVRILNRTITDPVSPAFMAPPVTRPTGAESVPAGAEVARTHES